MSKSLYIILFLTSRVRGQRDRLEYQRDELELERNHYWDDGNVAPEMFTNRPYTAAVDVWALGSIIARHLSGLRLSDSTYITRFKKGDARGQG